MFKHALVRDVAYASLLKAPRQQLHRRIGEALRDQFPERAESEPEVIAYQFAQAGLSEAAVEWWNKAGDLALQRSANIEAIAHLEKALELSQELGDSPEQRLQRLRLQIIYGNALRTVRGFAASETRAAFARAPDLAGTLDDVPERFSALHGLYSASFFLGELTAMRELAHAFLRNVEGRPELPETGVAHRICGMTSWFAGDFIDARQHFQRALDCYDDERDRPLAFRFGQDLAVPAVGFLALTLLPLGIGDGVRCLVEKTIAHALGTKHVSTIVYAYVHASFLQMMRRDRLRSRPYFRAYLELAREHVMPQWLAVSVVQEGWLRCHAGDQGEGARQMRDGLRPMK
jgi:tetratricopeptide (TPR) repeat protein